MKTLGNYLLLFMCVATLLSCAAMEGVFGADVVYDPEVQRSAGNLVQNILSGNWTGAIYSAGELAITATAAVKATNMVRDSKRKKRGEATGSGVVVLESPAVSVEKA